MATMQIMPLRKLFGKSISSNRMIVTASNNSVSSSSSSSGSSNVNCIITSAVNGNALKSSGLRRKESHPVLLQTNRRNITTSGSFFSYVQRPPQLQLNTILKAHISSTGKDRAKYAYKFNRHKQHKSKNKKTAAEKDAIKAKLGFKLDTTQPLSELLRYSDKFHSKRGPQSNRSFIKKYRITRFGKEAIPDAAPRATEFDADGYSIDPDLGGKSLDNWLASIDTSLTPEQQEKVARLKHKMVGAGPKGHGPIRSLYREVPRPEEIQGSQNYMPKIPPNAQELIDYALSHIPERDGPRRNREKKRMTQRWEQKVKDHAVKTIHNREAKQRKLIKAQQSRALTQAYFDMAERINAGEVPSSGPHITALHPCNNPSMYAPTSRKQRDYKLKLRMRDYRLPNPGGIKGLRITDEAKRATSAAIKEEQRADRAREEKKMRSARVMGSDVIFKATTAHMHKRRQVGKN